VVLIHGWALNLREWDDQVAALKFGFRVVAFDRRGYGKSTGFPDVSADPGDLRAVARRSGLDSLLTFVLAQPAFAGLQTPEFEGRIRAMWAAYSGKDVLEDHPPSDRFPPARFDDVKRWPIPTAFIVGDGEAPFTRLIADSLARWMPNARSVVIAGGAHGVHFQQPERFSATLLAFLTGLARGR
jgi:pimeloyl-ACP methyl ester carboxylesterase